MIEHQNFPLIEQMGQDSYTHTARINEGLFDVLKLREFSAEIPVQNFKVETLRKRMFAPGNNYWTDSENNQFEVSELLNNWESAQDNPLWQEHVNKIINADFNYPIWLYGEHDTIVDGAHRLAAALLNNIPEIPMQRGLIYLKKQSLE